MNTILGLDIGTEFVKASLISFEKDQLKILGVGKAEHRAGTISRGGITNIPSAVATCEKALMLAEDMADIRAKSVVVNVPGELIKDNITSVHYTRTEPDSPILESEITEIIQKVQAKTKSAAEKVIALESGISTKIELVNSTILSFTIDNFEIANPIGFKGSDVAVKFYTAFAPAIYLSAIEKTVAELNLELLAFASEPFAAYRAYIGNVPDVKSSCIILDIGRSSTNIVFITNNIIESTKTLLIGAKQIARTPKGLLTFLSGLELILTDFTNISDLPQKILLCGGGAQLSQISAALASSEWWMKLPFSRQPKIQAIDVQNLPSFIKIPEDNRDLSSVLDPSFTIALGLASIGADSLDDSSTKKNLRAKISKILQN